MPKIIQETEVQLDRADLMNRVVLERPATTAERSSGVHLSGVLRYIAQTSGITDYIDQVNAEDVPLLWALGVAWEEFCVSLYPDIIWQPGETLITGECASDPFVWGTCDGVNLKADQIEEFKYTSKKGMTGEELIRKQWLWMQQGRGYCLGYEFERVRWHVLYNNQPWVPRYARYLIEFSREELAQSERMIRENAPRAAKAGYVE